MSTHVALAEAVEATIVKVLHIEDDPLEVRLVEKALTSSVAPKYDITSVMRLDDALALLNREPFDVILLDLGLPDSEIYETFAKVRAAARDTAIVIASCCQDEALALQAVKDGAQDYLPKGKFNFELLTRTIRYAYERKRAERALYRTNHRYRTLIETTQEGVWVLDHKLVTTFVNGRMAEMLGCGLAEMEGATLAQFEDASGEPLSAALAAPAGQRQHDVKLVRKDGTHFWALITTSTVAEDTEGDGAWHLLMVTDITARKELEKQLWQSQKMDAIGRLAAGVAHDFNNALMVIRGYAELLRERMGNKEPERRYTGAVLDACKSAGSVVQQLLTFSRKQVLAPKTVSLQAVVEGTVEMLDHVLPENIDLQVVGAGAAGNIMADPAQLEQLLINLAVNARDAMPDGGQLLIETRDAVLDADFARNHPFITPGRYVMLAVRDSGRGMDAETQAHVFEPFFTTKTGGKGVGLGLATVYATVKQSEGYVLVDTAPDRGTAFTIYFPCSDFAVEPAGPGEAPAALSPITGTVLLVEDRDDVRESLAEVIESKGYAVVKAANADEALRIGASQPVDVLLTDLTMPGMGGYELAAALTESRPDIQVIYMSGHSEDIGRARRNGAFLQKPFSLATLIKSIDAAMRH